MADLNYLFSLLSMRGLVEFAAFIVQKGGRGELADLFFVIDTNF